LRAVRRPEDARLVELVNDPRRTAVPDPKATLQQRGRSLSELDADLGRLTEQRVPLLQQRELRVLALLLRLQRPDHLEDVVLGSRTLRRAPAVPLHEPLGVLRRQERALNPDRVGLPRR